MEKPKAISGNEVEERLAREIGSPASTRMSITYAKPRFYDAEEMDAFLEEQANKLEKVDWEIDGKPATQSEAFEMALASLTEAKQLTELERKILYAGFKAGLNVCLLDKKEVAEALRGKVKEKEARG